MTTVNGWIEKVKSGLFEDTDATGDAGESKTRTYTESELKVLTSLSQREEELKRKEALHRQRAAELKKLSQQIEQKLDSFKKLTADFENKRKLRKEMDERDITTMVRYCETMDPERIAVFFNQMDRVTASQILMRMNPRKASAVWELLEPKVAVELIEMVTRFKQNRQEAR
ncbi:MAG: hypothetical protein GY866_25325 [Proteobacteria bacterium]|nr:hypothetical protein [Pseudomonadota bacterium]